MKPATMMNSEKTDTNRQIEEAAAGGARITRTTTEAPDNVALAVSNALVGEPCVLSDGEEDSTSSNGKKKLSACRSSPSSKSAGGATAPRTTTSSATAGVATQDETVGVVASGISWVLRGQQQRRRRYDLQQEARRQMQKMQSSSSSLKDEQEQQQQQEQQQEQSLSQRQLQEEQEKQQQQQDAAVLQVKATTSVSASGDGYSVHFHDVETLMKHLHPDESEDEDDLSWIPTVRVVEPTPTLKHHSTYADPSSGSENSGEDSIEIVMAAAERPCNVGDEETEATGTAASSSRAPTAPHTEAHDVLNEATSTVVPELKPPCILTAQQRQDIATTLLPRQIAGTSWIRLYSLQRDGDSFDTCLRLIAGADKTLMVVLTTRNDILGGYADTAWVGSSAVPHHHHHHNHPTAATTSSTTAPHHHVVYHGGPQSCLFRFDTTGDNDKHNIRVYRWTGINRYIQLIDVEHKRLAFGGSGHTSEDEVDRPHNRNVSVDDPTTDNKQSSSSSSSSSSWCFGLSVEQDFQLGSTGRCDTFHNEPLCAQETFGIVNVEIFGFLVRQF